MTPTWIFADENQTFNLRLSNVNYSATTSKTLSANETLNMAAVLKGDVNGSWGTSAAASTRVEYGVTRHTLQHLPITYALHKTCGE